MMLPTGQIHGTKRKNEFRECFWKALIIFKERKIRASENIRVLKAPDNHSTLFLSYKASKSLFKMEI